MKKSSFQHCEMVLLYLFTQSRLAYISMLCGKLCYICRIQSGLTLASSVNYPFWIDYMRWFYWNKNHCSCYWSTSKRTGKSHEEENKFQKSLWLGEFTQMNKEIRVGTMILRFYKIVNSLIAWDVTIFFFLHDSHLYSCFKIRLLWKQFF